jgi:hypothetical protein
MEVAGLFGVNRGGKIFLVFVKNNGARPGHFEIDWPDFHEAKKKIRGSGVRYIGIFHSHPIWYAKPGPGDIRRAKPNEFHLIYDVCGTDARLWRTDIVNGRKKSIEIPLRIERTSRAR